MATHINNHAVDAQKYLTFRLGEETYGVDILRVQEIIGIMPITAVPRTPAYVRGVINLRGRVIPVVDLRKKFAVGEALDTERTCIVVVQTEDDAGTVMGAVVDEVSEVLDIPAANIEDTPSFGDGVETEFVLGMGKMNDQVIILLDIQKVLSGSDIVVLKGLNDADSESAA